MAAVQTSAPVNEPVCLDAAKAHLKVDHADEDALIANLIESARITVENITGLILITQSWSIFFDAWPGVGQIELPVAPVQSVSALNIFSDDDIAAPIDPAGYYVDIISRPARIVLRTSAVRPSPGRIANGIGIDLVCGYGANDDAVPEALRQAILQLTAHWFDNRTTIEFGTVPHPVPLGVSALLSAYRSVRL